MTTVATITVTGQGHETKSAERVLIAAVLERALSLLSQSANANSSGTVTIDTIYGANSGTINYNPVASKS